MFLGVFCFAELFEASSSGLSFSDWKRVLCTLFQAFEIEIEPSNFSSTCDIVMHKLHKLP